MEGKISSELIDIAVTIRKYRELYGWTREEFSEKIGVDTNYWGQIERGERAINILKLIEACKVLEIEPNQLIKISSPNSKNISTEKEINEIYKVLKKCSASQVYFIRNIIFAVINLIK